MKHKTDHELTQSFRGGDEKAFEEIFIRYWRQAHTFVSAKVSSREIAKEIVQEVFADLWDRRAERDIQNFSNYLFQALKYKTINHINRLIKQKRYWDDYKVFVPENFNQTQHDVNFEMLSDALESSLHQMPEKTSRVFRLNRLEGKSLSEIAKAMNLTEKAIQYHLTKSLKELRVHLKDYILLLILISTG